MLPGVPPALEFALTPSQAYNDLLIRLLQLQFYLFNVPPFFLIKRVP
jgi:hypothetical protein